MVLRRQSCASIDANRRRNKSSTCYTERGPKEIQGRIRFVAPWFLGNVNIKSVVGKERCAVVVAAVGPPLSSAFWVSGFVTERFAPISDPPSTLNGTSLPEITSQLPKTCTLPAFSPVRPSTDRHWPFAFSVLLG